MRYLDNKSPQEVEAMNESKMGLWRYGKKQYKEFTNYHVKKTTFIKTTIFGIILSIIVLICSFSTMKFRTNQPSDIANLKKVS